MEPYNTDIHVQMDGRVEGRKEKKGEKERKTDRHWWFFNIN